MTIHSDRFPSLSDIREAHGWKRDYEKYLPVSRFLFRPLGFLLTWAAVRIGLTTESVAWLSGLVGITAYVFLITGTGNTPAIGIGLLLFFNLLDCVDGSIARSTKTENPYGKFLDSICGGIIDLAFWGVISIMVFRNENLLSFKSPFGYGPIFWLALGSMTCFLSILISFLERTFDMTLMDYWNEIRNRHNEVKVPFDTESQMKTHHEKESEIRSRYVIRMINNNLRVRESHYILLLFLYWSEALDLLLAFYFLYYLSYSSAQMITYARRGKKIRLHHFRNSGHC